MISLKDKTKLIKKHGQSENDVGSSEIQVAIFTARIELINKHLQNAPKDKMANRGLLQLVGKRRRLLDYLKRIDSNRYQKIIKQLNLRKIKFRSNTYWQTLIFLK